MDTTVRALAEVVIAALRAAHYMESTIGQYRRAGFKPLGEFIAAHGGYYTPKLGAQFAAMTTSPRTGEFSSERWFMYGRVVRLVDSYIATGEVDLSVCCRGGGGPHPLTSEFVRFDAAWDAEMRARGLATATREAYGRVTRGFLVYLEDHGVGTLDDAGPGQVTGFLESLLDRWAKTSLYWVVSNFRPFLRFTGRDDLVDALGLVGVRRSWPVLPVIADDDVRRVVDACTTGVVNARDAAITLLALMTGLRSCDIINLRLGDIDWRTATVSLVQRKTGNPLTLPLPGVLLDRLADYVLTQRSTCTHDHVFARELAPFGPLGDHSTIHRITTTVFAKAGVGAPNAGTRLLRHTAATRLMRAATPLPTVSAVLGHAQVESTRVYLAVDDERLRRCVLPVAGAGGRP